LRELVHISLGGETDTEVNELVNPAKCARVEVSLAGTNRMPGRTCAPRSGTAAHHSQLADSTIRCLVSAVG
jgi:hypothetical protein